MRKILFSLIGLVLIFNNLKAQTTTPVRGDTVLVTNVNKNAVLKIQNATKDTIGFLHNEGGGKTAFKVPVPSDIRGLNAAISSATVFPANIVNNTSVQIGSVGIGQTLNSAGLNAYQVLQMIFTQTIHPTYNLPTASLGIASGNAPGFYDYGANISATFSSTFTQNQGGSLISTTYKQGSTTVTNVSITGLSTSVSYTVQKAYNTGVCIANNLGTIDCTVGAGNAPNPAPIAAGTAISNTITYAPSPRIYYGRAAGTAAVAAELTAAYNGTGGGGSSLTFGHAGTWTVIASGSNHPFIAIDNSQGTITVIKDVNNFDVTSSFPKTTITYTNPFGAVRTMDIYTFVTATSSNYTFTTN